MERYRRMAHFLFEVGTMRKLPRMHRQTLLTDDTSDAIASHYLKDLIDEYQQRKTKEAIITKNADLLDQILLLREYEWQGNREATVWLRGKGGVRGNAQLKKLTLPRARKLGQAIYTVPPSAWWDNLWTSTNR